MYFGGRGKKKWQYPFFQIAVKEIAWEFIFSTKKIFQKLNLEKKIHRSNKSEKRSFCESRCATWKVGKKDYFLLPKARVSRMGKKWQYNIWKVGKRKWQSVNLPSQAGKFSWEKKMTKCTKKKWEKMKMTICTIFSHFQITCHFFFFS